MALRDKVSVFFAILPFPVLTPMTFTALLLLRSHERARFSLVARIRSHLDPILLHRASSRLLTASYLLVQEASVPLVSPTFHSTRRAKLVADYDRFLQLLV